MPHLVRASDIGAHLFCRRAWWYRKQGAENENLSELAGGTELHLRHGRQVMAAGLLQIAGYVLLLAAIAMIVYGLTERLLR